MSATATNSARSAASQTAPVNELRRGLGPLVGGVVFYAGSPIIIAQTQSIMIQPIMEDTGLPATAVTISPWIVLFLGLLQPVVGVLLKKYPPRPFIIATVVINALALTALALVPASWASFWIIAFAVGIAGSLGYWVAISRMLSYWFRRNLGVAVGIVGGAASLLPLIALPVMSYFIYNGGGWRAGYAVLAVYVVVFTLPLVILLFRQPKQPLFADDRALTSEAVADAADGAISGMEMPAILRDGRFWILGLCWLIASIALGGFLANLAAVAIDRGFDPAFATGLSMALLAGTIIGRVGGGVVVDRTWPYAGPILAFTLSGIAALMIAYMPTTTPIALMWIVAAVLGLAQGAEGDYMSFFSLREFGAKNFTVVNGVMFLLTGVAAFVGGMSFAVVKDITGSYEGATAVISCAYLVSAGLALIAGLVSLRASRRGAQFYAGKSAANLEIAAE